MFCVVVLVAVVLAGCAPERHGRTQRAEEIAAIERRIHDLVNEYRAANGLQPLVWNEAISYQALLHSEKMATKGVAFSHAGFEGRAAAIARFLPYRDCAENIGLNLEYADPALKFVEDWIQSHGHRKNLEGRFNLTGIGVARSEDGTYYATQIFVLTR